MNIRHAKNLMYVEIKFSSTQLKIEGDDVLNIQRPINKINLNYISFKLHNSSHYMGSVSCRFYDQLKLHNNHICCTLRFFNFNKEKPHIYDWNLEHETEEKKASS